MTVESLSIHTITVQENTAVSDGKGGTPDSWVNKHVDIRARIQPLATPASAAERSQWGGTPSIITHRIYVPDASLEILESDRIVFGSRIFDIQTVRDIDEWGRFLTIDAREIKDG